MKSALVLIAAFAVIVGLGQSAAAQPLPAPPVGVYGCMGQFGPALPMMFGLLDAKTYSNFDGKTGRYSYDAAKGLLTLVDGPLAGIKYRRIGAAGANPAFRMLDDKGQLTAFTCPKEGTKDPHKHPW